MRNRPGTRNGAVAAAGVPSRNGTAQGVKESRMWSMQPVRRAAARTISPELQWALWSFLGGFAVSLAASLLR